MMGWQWHQLIQLDHMQIICTSQADTAQVSWLGVVVGGHLALYGIRQTNTDIGIVII